MCFEIFDVGFRLVMFVMEGRRRLLAHSVGSCRAVTLPSIVRMQVVSVSS